MYRLVFLAQRGEELILGDYLLGLLLDEIEMQQQQLLQVLDLGEIVLTGLVAAEGADAEGRGRGRCPAVGHAGVHVIEVAGEAEDAGGGGSSGCGAAAVDDGLDVVAVNLLELLAARVVAIVAVIGTEPDVAHHHCRRMIIVAAGDRVAACRHHSRRRRGR